MSNSAEDYHQLEREAQNFRSPWDELEPSRQWAAQLISYRSDNNLSSEDLALRLMLSKEQVDELESGEQPVDSHQQKMIIDALGITLDGMAKPPALTSEVSTVKSDSAPLADGEGKITSSDYFDDEEFLHPSDDKIIDASLSSALIKQYENVITWHLDGFYNDDGSRKSKLSLQASPPLLTIESSDGETAVFVLTQNVTKSLSEITDTVWRGYFGVGAKKSSSLNQKNAQNRIVDATDWVTRHTGLTVVVSIIIFILIIATFR